jgi:hypothetical protein
MDRSQFQQLKQYVGADLLNYALNRADIVYPSDSESLTIVGGLGGWILICSRSD